MTAGGGKATSEQTEKPGSGIRFSLLRKMSRCMIDAPRRIRKSIDNLHVMTCYFAAISCVQRFVTIYYTKLYK
jgi:hypothetical protein